MLKAVRLGKFGPVSLADDSEKIEYERNHYDRSDDSQPTACAPSRIAVVATATAEQQQQDYD
jgi:hypothetical protein